MISVETLKATHKPLPVPDPTAPTNAFDDWGIWTNIADSDASLAARSPESNLGLLLIEGKVATKRMGGWTAALVVLGLVFALLANISPSNVFIPGLISLSLLGAALSRIATWILNRDLRVRIFRQGLSLRQKGKTRVVRWQEIHSVHENWQKIVIQAIIHINIHNLKLKLMNGQEIKMDLKLDKIEQIGRLIQAAVANCWLPIAIEHLAKDGTCEFGSFKINRYGIEHGAKMVLPWSEVCSLDVYTHGQTTIRINKLSRKKQPQVWKTESGGAVMNLWLFLGLARWFIDEAKKPSISAPASLSSAAVPPERQNKRDEYLEISISGKEAQQGTQKIFYVGAANQERRLAVQIPAGASAGMILHYPGFGRPEPGGGPAGTLHVALKVETSSSSTSKLEGFQIVIGMLFSAFGILWLAFWSSLDPFTSTILAALIGGIGGTLIAVKKRGVGAISGASGGALCFLIQFFYFTLMYLFFGRESFWSFEVVLVLLVSLAPGIGLYAWLSKVLK